MAKKPAGYAVYCCERLRDGVEEWGRCYSSLEEALAYINRCATGFAGDSIDFKLFELGKQIPLQQEDVEQPQPPKKERHYFVEAQ